MKITKVVPFDQVEQLTSNGWVLVCNVQNQRIDTKKEIEQHQHSDERGRWVPDKYKIDTAVVSETLFVLEKDAEAVDLDKTLLGKIQHEQRQNSDLRSKLFDHQEANRATVKERDELAGKLTTEIDEHRRTRELSRTQDASLRKFEGDLAKIRKAIGELKWAEIIGAKP